MKKILLALGLLLASISAKAAPAYEGTILSTGTGTAAHYLSGSMCIAASSGTAGTCGVSLNGNGTVSGSGTLSVTAPLSVSSPTTVNSLLTASSATVTNWLQSYAIPRYSVVMFPPPGLSAGSCPWLVAYSTGALINTTGTTTCGLQEAINASAPNGIPLYVQGGGSTASGGTQPYIVATSQVSVPAVQGWRWDALNVNLTFATSVSTDCLKFDSTEITDVNFQGQIVCQSTGAAVRFSPHTNLPIDGFAANDASHFYFSNVVQQPPVNSTATAVMQFDPTNSVVSNIINLGEINGQAHTKYCVYVSTPGASTVFAENHLLINNPHQCAIDYQDGYGSSNQANIHGNYVEINSCRPTGFSVPLLPGVCVNSYGSNDVFQENYVSNAEGSVSTATVFNAGANNNIVILGGTSGLTGTTLTDNGSANTLFTGPGSRVPNLSVTTVPGVTFVSTPGAMQPLTDSVNAIQLRTAGGTSILNVDSTNQRVGISTGSPQTTLEVAGTGGFDTPISSTVYSASALSATWTTTSLGACIAGSTITITMPIAGNVMVGFTGTINNGTLAAVMQAAFLMDGVFQNGASAANGNIATTQYVAANILPITFSYPITGVSAGTHNFCLSFNTSAGTGNFSDGLNKDWVMRLP